MPIKLNPSRRRRVISAGHAYSSSALWPTPRPFLTKSTERVTGKPTQHRLLADENTSHSTPRGCAPSSSQSALPFVQRHVAHPENRLLLSKATVVTMTVSVKAWTASGGSAEPICSSSMGPPLRRAEADRRAGRFRRRRLRSTCRYVLPPHQLRDLNEIAAGVVQLGDLGGGHVRWWHGELGAARFHTLVIGLHVVGEEHGRGWPCWNIACW
jgi:hypothetical protein